MGKFLNKITPEWALRAGLGVMYVYSGADIISHPTAWYWAVRPLFRFLPLSAQAAFTGPSFMINFLRVQGGVEIIFAIVLLAWFLPKKYAKWVAGLTTLEMAGILFLIPIDAVTFRDFGLLGAGLALFLILRGDSYIKPKPPIDNPPSISKPEIKPGEGPIVQTFDQYMGKK